MQPSFPQSSVPVGHLHAVPAHVFPPLQDSVAVDEHKPKSSHAGVDVDARSGEHEVGPQGVPPGFGVEVGQLADVPLQDAAFVQPVAARHWFPFLNEHTPFEAAVHSSHSPLQSLSQQT
jgi:hypothetical protein